MTLAIGDTAPDLTLAAERAIAAVAVMPPKNGEIIHYWNDVWYPSYYLR